MSPITTIVLVMCIILRILLAERVLVQPQNVTLLDVTVHQPSIVQLLYALRHVPHARYHATPVISS
jgi:hypothetical protein